MIIQYLFSVENRLTSNEVENIVPGTASVFVNTWGCAHNSSDSEYMAGQLAAQVNYTMMSIIISLKGLSTEK